MCDKHLYPSDFHPGDQKFRPGGGLKKDASAPSFWHKIHVQGCNASLEGFDLSDLDVLSSRSETVT